jgi:hypothetical protein
LYFAERVKAWMICPLLQSSESSHLRLQATHGVAIEVPLQPPDRRRVIRLRGDRKRHLANVYEKVGVRSRNEAVRIALEEQCIGLHEITSADEGDGSDRRSGSDHREVLRTAEHDPIHPSAWKGISRK